MAIVSSVGNDVCCVVVVVSTCTVANGCCIKWKSVWCRIDFVGVVIIIIPIIVVVVVRYHLVQGPIERTMNGQYEVVILVVGACFVVSGSSNLSSTSRISRR